MTDTTGITGKRKNDLPELILHIHSFGRLVLGITGFLFILLGAITLLYSCFDLIGHLTDGTKNMISVFVQGAEYYLITLTFVLIGRSVIAFAHSTETKTENLRKLKESLLAMIISISGVAFIEMILECETAAELGIDILYVGVAIASVIVALGIFIRLGMQKKEEEEIETE